MKAVFIPFGDIASGRGDFRVGDTIRVRDRETHESQNFIVTEVQETGVMARKE